MGGGGEGAVVSGVLGGKEEEAEEDWLAGDFKSQGCFCKTTNELSLGYSFSDEGSISICYALLCHGGLCITKIRNELKVGMCKCVQYSQEQFLNVECLISSDSRLPPLGQNWDTQCRNLGPFLSPFRPPVIYRGLLPSIISLKAFKYANIHLLSQLWPV